MDSAIWGFIGTIIGAIVGASASIFTTLLNGWNSAKLQKKGDQIERMEHAREFQRNTLLELQDTLLQNFRLIGRAHLEDLSSFRKSRDGKRTNLLSEDLNHEIMLSNRNLTSLNERIANDELRDNLKKLHQDLNNVLFANSENESKEKLNKAASNFEIFMTKLGEILRSNY